MGARLCEGLPAACTHQPQPSVPGPTADLLLLPGQGPAGRSSLHEVPVDLREVTFVKLCDKLPLLSCHLLSPNQQQVLNALIQAPPYGTVHTWGPLHRITVRLDSGQSAKAIPLTSGSQPVDHDPSRGLNNLFTGVAYQISCISGIYVMVHKNSKITVKK